MNIQVTRRHGEIREVVKKRVYEKLKPILADYPRIENVHVILDAQRFQQIVEIVVQAKQHIIIEARESAEDMIKSIDNAIEKLDRQLRRAREKLVEHKHEAHRTKISDFE